MAYSSSALTSAMSRSLYFEGIFKPASNNEKTFTVGSFENCGYYKLTFISQKTTVIVEFAQGRIVSAQSVSDINREDENYEEYREFKVQLVEDEFNQLSSIFRISNLILPEIDTIFSLNIEYSGGEFSLDPSISTTNLSGNFVRSFKFNTTEYGIGIVTSDVSATNINIQNLAAEEVYIKKMQFGDWELSTDPISGNVTLALKPINTNS